MASTGRRRRPATRCVPIGYMATAVVLAAVLLPSALRPPQDQQSTTASFSPDAPPDDAPPEVVLQSMRAASSATAGADVAETEEVVEEEVVVEERQPPPRPARGRCFGEPPRQTESLYSTRSIPAWTGADNGGRTAPGVYPDEIRIGIAVTSSSRTLRAAWIESSTPKTCPKSTTSRSGRCTSTSASRPAAATSSSTW